MNEQLPKEIQEAIYGVTTSFTGETRAEVLSIDHVREGYVSVYLRHTNSECYTILDAMYSCERKKWVISNDMISMGEIERLTQLVPSLRQAVTKIGGDKE